MLKFEHFENMLKSRIWFTSDTHFGQDRTFTLWRRPFKSVREMDREIIKRWNSVVEPDDIVYHLGDFGYYERVNELNGHIRLLCGNYELSDISKFYNNEPLKFYNKLINLGFNDVFIEGYNRDEIVTIHSLIGDINMVHEPSKLYAEIPDDEHNIFGHIHNTQRIKKRGLNVGVDVHNYTPIDLETVSFYTNAIKNHYDNEVFMQ